MLLAVSRCKNKQTKKQKQQRTNKQTKLINDFRLDDKVPSSCDSWKCTTGNVTILHPPEPFIKSSQESQPQGGQWQKANPSTTLPPWHKHNQGRTRSAHSGGRRRGQGTCPPSFKHTRLKILQTGSQTSDNVACQSQGSYLHPTTKDLASTDWSGRLTWGPSTVLACRGGCQPPSLLCS